VRSGLATPSPIRTIKITSENDEIFPPATISFLWSLHSSSTSGYIPSPSGLSFLSLGVRQQPFILKTCAKEYTAYLAAFEAGATSDGQSSRKSAHFVCSLDVPRYYRNSLHLMDQQHSQVEETLLFYFIPCVVAVLLFFYILSAFRYPDYSLALAVWSQLVDRIPR